MLFNGTSVNDRKDIFFSELFKDFPACFLALEKYFPCVIRAHYYDAEIGRVKVYVDIEQELFRYAWYTYWSPSLSILHRRVRINVVQQNCYI